MNSFSNLKVRQILVFFSAQSKKNLHCFINLILQQKKESFSPRYTWFKYSKFFN